MPEDGLVIGEKMLGLNGHLSGTELSRCTGAEGRRKEFEVRAGWLCALTFTTLSRVTHLLLILHVKKNRMPIPVAERPEARVCGSSLAGVAGSHLAWDMDACCVCCEVEVSATDRSLVQRSATEYGVSCVM